MTNQPTDDPLMEPDTSSGGRVWTLALACVAMFMLMLDVTVVNVALPGLGRSLDADFTGLQWVIDAYTLALAAFLLIGGSLGDRLGRKQVFLLGLVLFTVSSLVAGLAQTMLTLNLARAAQGVGGAVLFAVGPALIGNEYRGADRGKAFGVFGAVAGLALACGPLVGGLVTDALSWRWIFLINIPVGVLAWVAGVRWLRESKQQQQGPLDWLGMLLIGLGLSLLVLALLHGESSGWTSPPVLAAFVSGALLVGWFIVHEQRLGETAMLDVGLLRNRTFAGVCVGTFLSNATSLSAVFLVILYLQNVLEYSPWQTGLRFMPMMLTLFVVAAATGPLINKVSPGALIGTSIALIGIGIGLITLVTPYSSWTALLPSMIVTGVGMGLFNPPRAAVTIGVVEPSRAGMASGVGETFQQVGVAIGIAGFGALFHSKVVDHFMFSAAGQGLAGEAGDVGQAVAAGGVTTLPERGTAVEEAARGAFVDALNSVMTMAAIVALIGAIVAATLIRRADLHESGLSEGSAPVPMGKL